MSVPLPPGCEPQCRACAYRGLDEAASAARKQDWLARRLAPWAAALAPLTATTGAARLGYRSRVLLAAERHAAGWRFGLRRRDGVLAIPDCPVHAPSVRAALHALAVHLPADFPLAYYAQSGAQATLIVKTRTRPATGWVDALAAALAGAGLDGLWLHRNPGAGVHPFTDNDWHLLWGAPRSRDADGLVYGPAAFQQPLPALHAAALDAATAFLAPAPGVAVADLYCGRGASLARWSAHGARALGVELGGEAVACARLNAPAAEVLRGTCRQRLAQLGPWFAAVPTPTRRVYANPPRGGLEAEVLEWIVDAARPARIAYLACAAAPLARDLAVLDAHGWRVHHLLPFDFFPQTDHVETLALLAR